MKQQLFHLSEMVGRRLRKKNLKGQTVVLTVRYSNFETFSRRQTLNRYINSGPDLYQAVTSLLEKIFLTHPVRLLGVSITNLKRDQELPLFPADLKKKQVLQAMDSINDRYGEFTLTWGTLLGNSFAVTHFQNSLPAVNLN